MGRAHTIMLWYLRNSCWLYGNSFFCPQIPCIWMQHQTKNGFPIYSDCMHTHRNWWQPITTLLAHMPFHPDGLDGGTMLPFCCLLNGGDMTLCYGDCLHEWLQGQIQVGSSLNTDAETSNGNSAKLRSCSWTILWWCRWQNQMGPKLNALTWEIFLSKADSNLQRWETWIFCGLNTQQWDQMILDLKYIKELKPII